MNGKTASGSRPVNAGAIILRDKPKNIGVARESPERGVRGEKLEVFSPVCGTAFHKKYNLCTEYLQFEIASVQKKIFSVNCFLHI